MENAPNFGPTRPTLSKLLLVLILLKKWPLNTGENASAAELVPMLEPKHGRNHFSQCGPTSRVPLRLSVFDANSRSRFMRPTLQDLTFIGIHLSHSPER